MEVAFMCRSYQHIHVSHIQLTYTVINMQDGGGDIHMWELLTCGSSIHV